jgi:hypothetical protein
MHSLRSYCEVFITPFVDDGVTYAARVYDADGLLVAELDALETARFIRDLLCIDVGQL